MECILWPVYTWPVYIVTKHPSSLLLLVLNCVNLYYFIWNSTNWSSQLGIGQGWRKLPPCLESVLQISCLSFFPTCFCSLYLYSSVYTVFVSSYTLRLTARLITRSMRNITFYCLGVALHMYQSDSREYLHAIGA